MFSLYLGRGQLESSVGEEKRFNPRLTKDIDTFVDIMEHLNLPKPKMIGKSDQFTYSRFNGYKTTFVVGFTCYTAFTSHTEIMIKF